MSQDTSTATTETAKPINLVIAQEVSALVASSGPTIKEKFTQLLVDKAINERVEILEKAYNKLNSLRTDFRKIKEDVVNFSSDGTQVKSYSAAVWKSRQETEEKVKNFESLLEKALSTNTQEAWSKLKEKL